MGTSRGRGRRIFLGAGLGLLGVGLGGAGIESGLLPGRSKVYSVLGLNGPPHDLPDVPAGQLVSGTFDSRARRTRVGWSIAYPAGQVAGASLPVVIALHGRFVDHRYLFAPDLGLDLFLAADPSLTFAIAAPDGGDSYWHPRASGEDAAAMITDEFLPLLEDHGLRTERVGLYGFSMGGYGALRLAGRLGPDRVAGVAVASPALWGSAGQTAEGAFDDARDFAANDVMRRQHELDQIAVRVDCGSGDGFAPAVERYRARFPADHRPAGGISTGAHDLSFWRRVAPAELAFLGRTLAG